MDVSLDTGFSLYDPGAKIDETQFAGVKICVSALDASMGADALVVMTPWKEFAGVDLEQIRSGMRGRHVIDPYGILNGEGC